MNSSAPKNAVQATIEYVDQLFGPGMGARHLRFLERIDNDALREMILRYHAVEADTRWLSIEENYLIGMCVLCAGGQLETAAMFAKTLLHIGTSKHRIQEAVARLGMWIGGLPAAEAAFKIARAIAEYEREGLASLRVWFPEATE